MTSLRLDRLLPSCWRTGSGYRAALALAAVVLAGVAVSSAADTGTGRVVGWGHCPGNPPPPAVDGRDGSAPAIAAGEYHSCAIQAGTGAVVCWGTSTLYTTPPPTVNGTTGSAEA